MFSPHIRLIDPQTQVTRLGVSFNNASFWKEKVREVCSCTEEPTSGFSSLVSVPAGRGVPVRSAPGKHQADGICGGGQGLERRGRRRGAHVQRLCVREQHRGGKGAADERMCAPMVHRQILNLSLCLPPQICYTISLAKDITEAKKVPSSRLLRLESELQNCGALIWFSGSRTQRGGGGVWGSVPSSVQPVACSSSSHSSSLWRHTFISPSARLKWPANSKGW